MGVILRSFSTPTDVYISGDYYEDAKVKSAFGITDDESGIDITDGTIETGLNTYGFVYIFTPKEFKAAIPSISELQYADEYDIKHWNWDGILLKDFVGDIKLVLESEEDCPERGIKKGDDVLKWQFDPGDYAWYQQSEKATKITKTPRRDGGFYESVSSIVRTTLKVILPPGTQMTDPMNTLQLIDVFNQRENDKSKDAGASD